MDLKYRALAIFSVSVMSIACADGSLLDSNLLEKEAVLSTDKTSIEVEAASFYADKQIADTLVVTSSRSWSVAPAVETAWLKISYALGINLGKVTKQWPVSLVFEDNLLPQDRSSELILTIDGDEVRVPVTQKALTPVLELESAASYDDISYLGADLALRVRSNCLWTASVEPSSDSDMLEILNAEGLKTDSLRISVKPNTNLYFGRTATVVLKAEGANDVRVTVSQKECKSALEIDRNLTPTEVLPAADSVRIVFSTNDNWTARLEDDAPEDVSLSVGSGQPGDDLCVIFPAATLDRTVSATVVITTEKDGLSESITFTQRPCMLINFRKYPDENKKGQRNKPLVNALTGKYDIGDKESNYQDAPISSWAGLDKATGYQYIFQIGSENTTFHSYQCGLVLGSTSANPAFSIEFPAVEGKRLKEVKIMLGNSDVELNNQESTATGTSGCITDAEGNIVEGGQTQNVSTYKPDDDWVNTGTIPSFYSDYHNHTESMFDFVLTGTEENTAYCYVGDYRQVIRWFILYYE